MNNVKEKNNRLKVIGWIIVAVIVISVLYFEVYKIYTGQGQLSTQSAFLLMLVLVVIGELVSTKTKAFMPSMFITGLLFILCFWTFFPKDILQIGGIASNLPTFFVMMMVVHLGTMLNIQELIEQWKTVLVTLAGMIGILIAILTVGNAILGMRTAAVAAPPLTGGLVAALMMQEAAGDNQFLAVLAMAVYVLQGFVGYPLTSLCLKKEGRNLIAKYKSGEIALLERTPKDSKKTKFTYDLFPKLPEKFKTDFTSIFSIIILIVVSGYLEILTNGIISKFVWALILGVFAQAMGFIEPNILVKSRSMGFVYLVIMMFVFSNLSSITPEILIELLKDFLILIVLATAGIALVAIPVGKALGLSVPMSFAIGLGSIAGGFPASYTLSVEAAKVVSSNEEERQLIEEYILPKTLVAGFVSATSGSVLIAGIVLAVFFR